MTSCDPPAPLPRPSPLQHGNPVRLRVVVVTTELPARHTHPELLGPGNRFAPDEFALVLWSDYEVAVVGSVHDIRALLTRALALLPHDSEGRHS